MKNINIKISALLILILFNYNCFKDLNTVPLDEDIITSAVVYDNPSSYLQVLAKLYAGLAVSGQQGPAGQSDIEGIDEGFGQYLRGYWYHQELTTDEAVVGWNDQTIKDFHSQTWTSDDGFTFAFYSRIFYQISLCNEFIRETTDEKLAERGVDDALKQDIKGYRAEARFLRALSYWHALDLFRNVPFVTEDDKVGAFLPDQTNATDLFSYIESELKAIESLIAAPRTNPYGRADQAAVWTLLAKLYLNAEVYINSSRYSESLVYCQKVIDAGFSLEPNFENLFLADNNLSNEIIFPITFDGVHTKTWGGMTFIIRAAIGGSMDPSDSGVSGGWGGTRTTKQLVQKFPEDVGGIIVAPNDGNSASYPKIYVFGEYQDWDGSNTSYSLSSINTDNIYEGYKYFDTDNSKFLISKYPAFGQVFGDTGADGTLEMNGDTIIAGEAGLYYFQVNLNDNTYIMEKRSWGIIGDATPTGWTEDTDMTWDEETQSLKITINLTEGEYKFRANDAWDIDLGDDNSDGILTQGGANIHNDVASTYEISLFLNRPDYTYKVAIKEYDHRPLFYSDGQSLDINDLTLFTDGWAVQKFKNVTSDGSPGSDSGFPDTDFPMFRLADVYLMASEAIIRDNGDMDLALEYFNNVRTRAYGGTFGNATLENLDLNLILDERARELYWECHRRTDLIRFGEFSNSSSYLWDWKGGVKEGVSVEGFRDIFPIPSSDLSANPNLQQNFGY